MSRLLPEVLCVREGIVERLPERGQVEALESLECLVGVVRVTHVSASLVVALPQCRQRLVGRAKLLHAIREDVEEDWYVSPERVRVGSSHADEDCNAAEYQCRHKRQAARASRGG